MPERKVNRKKLAANLRQGLKAKKKIPPKLRREASRSAKNLEALTKAGL